MKRYMKLFAITLLSLIIVVIPGCKKIYDYVDSHPNAELKICPIETIVFNTAYSNYVDTLTFKYNIWGDPISISRPNPSTGAPNYEFRYDKAGRLTDFIGVYSNGIWTELWHRYFYDRQNRIVTDSVYVFAEMINGELHNPNDSYVNLLNYDSKNRVSTETRIWDGHTDVLNYSYDVNGNRSGYLYDQKINFHRTNKIWMFIDRDYSLNNPFQAINYNPSGLPTTIALTMPHYITFLNNYFLDAWIAYKCDNQKLF